MATRAAADGRPTVGVIGLGIMGSAIAVNLRQAGFRVIGADVSDGVRRRLRGKLDQVTADAGEVVAQAVRIVVSLPGVAALEAVSHALAGARPGRSRIIVAETSTLPIEAKQAARERLAEARIALLDAPLSGTGAQARTRDLGVYASGEPAAIRAMKPVFAGFARQCFEVGAFGNGMRMKLVANLLVAIHNVSSAEALLFARRLGLDPARALAVVADGAGGSRMLSVRGPAMVGRRWQQATMKLEVWRKDMALIHGALEALDVPAPLFAACQPIYAAALAQGHALHDTAAVYAVLERMAQAQP
ncbi:MAG: NAD(P)-dependent oxidoreductase [Burkholderiaceae bacterium]